MIKNLQHAMLLTIIIIIIIIIICALPAAESLAQNTNNLILPSPSAASFAKFGSIAVSPSNGTPKISVPVFAREGTSNKCGLVISLDYHAGGVRVDEIASNVGMSWALNGGVS